MFCSLLAKRSPAAQSEKERPRNCWARTILHLLGKDVRGIALSRDVNDVEKLLIDVLANRVFVLD